MKLLMLLLIIAVEHTVNTQNIEHFRFLPNDIQTEPRSDDTPASDNTNKDNDYDIGFDFATTAVPYLYVPPSYKIQVEDGEVGGGGYSSDDSDDRASSDFGSTNIAAKAAQVATAANDAQSNAAECAAKEVKMQLAEKAIQANNAVQLVLQYKKALVEHLQTEMQSSERFNQYLDTSIKRSIGQKQKLDVSLKAAENHLQHMRKSENQMQGSLKDIKLLRELSNLDFISKRRMLSIAKKRADRLQNQVQSARSQYEQVKIAAYQAACAAVEARRKADALSSTLSNSNCDSYSNIQSKRKRQQEETNRRRPYKRIN